MLKINQCATVMMLCLDIEAHEQELKTLQSIPIKKLTYKNQLRYIRLLDEIAYLTEEARNEYQKFGSNR